MTRIHRAASFAALGGILIFAGSTVRAQSNINAADRKFMMDSAQGGMAEVALGRLASKKGSSASVKQFGRKMVADHSKANGEMKTLAAQKGVGLPPALSEGDQAEMGRLSKLKGAAFDKEYMNYMTADHRQDVAEFEKEVGKAKDSDVKNFAAKTLPALQDHLKMAEKIGGKLGGAAAARSAGRDK